MNMGKVVGVEDEFRESVDGADPFALEGGQAPHIGFFIFAAALANCSYV